MPRDVVEFRIVVASPSSPADVLEFRKIVFEVIDEMNTTFEIQKLAIRHLGWEEYASPGIGDHPQAVVSGQLLKEYDILIALFTTSLGTPTLNARSGTVEEIEHAIANKNSDLGQFRVQVYFIEQTLSPTNLLALEELRKVIEYREELGQRGVFY